MGADSLRLRAEQAPRFLWQKALTEIQRYLGQRGVTLPQGLQEPSNFVTYLTAIFHGFYPQEKIGPRNSRELRTIAEALDSLGNGNLPKTADLLVQRFKAVEESDKNGSCEDSSFLELIQRDAVGLTSSQERLVARSFTFVIDGVYCWSRMFPAFCSVLSWSNGISTRTERDARGGCKAPRAQRLYALFVTLLFWSSCMFQSHVP